MRIPRSLQLSAESLKGKRNTQNVMGIHKLLAESAKRKRYPLKFAKSVFNLQDPKTFSEHRTTNCNRSLQIL